MTSAATIFIKTEQSIQTELILSDTLNPGTIMIAYGSGRMVNSLSSLRLTTTKRGDWHAPQRTITR